MIEFKLKTEADNDNPYIELNKLLKYTQMCESGAMANQCVVDGMVKLNGVIEGRKRAKIRVGDEVQFEDTVIKVVRN